MITIKLVLFQWGTVLLAGKAMTMEIYKGDHGKVAPTPPPPRNDIKFHTMLFDVTERFHFFKFIHDSNTKQIKCEDETDLAAMPNDGL